MFRHNSPAPMPDSAASKALLEPPEFPTTQPSHANQERQVCFSELFPYWLAHLKHERRFSDSTIRSYRISMKVVIREIGDIPPQKLNQMHVLHIKTRCAERDNNPNTVKLRIHALRSFLVFCQLTLNLEVLNPKTIKAPKIPKRDVVFLTPKEVQQYVSGIPIRKSSGEFHMVWLRFRTLVEVLLGTAMRISEALSLERSSINFETGETTIIGKGNKERMVFFSPRALGWVKEYLSKRTDRKDVLFLSFGRPMTCENARAYFARFQEMSGLMKKVTPHILRHTAATTLLHNGCPIGYIKEILGHEDLMTTCKYYLGTDKRGAKKAHVQYLDYEGGE